MHVFWLIWLLAAPSAAEGACAGPADRGWLAENYPSLAGISKDCAFDCLTDDAACAARCVQSATALSEPCTGCFGTLIDCTTSECAMRCIVASSDMCANCRAEHCEPAFEACAGVTVRR